MPYGKVLVVDDVMMNLDVIKGLMMPYGLQVDTAMSGREAVEIIRRETVRYDLIFMDHMMPEMDGIQAARIIRQEIGSEYARNIPIIALTANAIAGNRELFLNSGFNDYISKPIDIKQLDMALNKWVRDKQSEETLKQAEKEQGKAGDTGGSAAGDEIFEAVEGIDLAAVKELYGNSAAAYMPVLKSFVTHTPPLLEEMRALIGEDLRQDTIKVHGLKGSCGTICAPQTAGMARELEEAAKGGDVDFVRTRHGALETAVRGLTAKLAARIGAWETGRGEGKREQKAGPERGLLERLVTASSEYKANEVEEILGELGRYGYETGGELVRWLREQADNFEYEAIQNRLKSFLGGEKLPSK
jgi:CheY-like chemotaxis protein